MTEPLVRAREILPSSAFPTTPATSDAGSDGRPDPSPRDEVFLCEIVGKVGQRGHAIEPDRFQKTGLVHDRTTGRTWRLGADEGTYMNGTNAAPAPIMYYGAGIHADLLTRIAAAVVAEGLAPDSLDATLRWRHSSDGSFARGEAVARVYEFSYRVTAVGSVDPAVLRRVVGEVLRTAPAARAVRRPNTSTFSLQINGHDAVQGLPGSDGRATDGEALDDPFRRHAVAPIPAGDWTGEVLLAPDRGPRHGWVFSDEQTGAFGWHLDVRGSVDVETGAVSSSVGFPEFTNDRWCLQSDPTGIRAPKPLALLSIGTAFCFHTQLARYADVRHLPIGNPRLAQWSRFTADPDDPVGSALRSRVFINGHCEPDAAEDLITAAERTCWAHRGLAEAVDVRFDTGVAAPLSHHDDHSDTARAAPQQ